MFEVLKVEKIIIYGEPSPWANENREENWRREIAQQLDLRNIKVDYKEDSEFEVKIKFLLRSDTFKKSDLDNLAKPIIDTIFKTSRSERFKDLTGRLIYLDDNKIKKLLLEKEIVNDNFGAEVEIKTINKC